MNTIIKSPKFMWAAGIVLAVLFFGPSIIGSIRRSVATLQKPSPAVPMQTRATSPTAPGGRENTVAASSPGGFGSTLQAQSGDSNNAVQSKLVGTWEGETLLDRGQCKLNLELRGNSQTQGAFSGFAKFACMPNVFKLAMRATEAAATRNKTAAEGAADNIMRNVTSTAEILSGNSEGNSIVLHAEKHLNENEESNPCRTKTMTLREFGSYQLAVDWSEDEKSECKGGQVLLKRTGK